MSDQERPFLLIGNPDNRRTFALQQARLRQGLKPAMVLSYIDLLHTWRQGRTLRDAVSEVISQGVGQEDADDYSFFIRMDAPGENWNVERELLSLGASVYSALHQEDHRMMVPQEQALLLEQEWGRIYAPAQWFDGWKACLERIDKEVQQFFPSARFLNHPTDIITMFDKRRCQQQLSANGITVPPSLQADVPIRSYGELRTAMKSEGMHRIFVKLACGSGASGVVAYQFNPRTGAEIAITTVGMERNGAEVIFYNEGSMRRYTRTEEIRILLDWLCAEGAQIERWMAKSTIGSRVFDVRQLVAGGQVGHAIVRLSKTPITNLHLRNDRLLPTEAGLKDEQMLLIQNAAQAALSAFPNSWSAGIDVMLSGTEPRAYVLDVNPFGDLLYRVQHHGLGTYDWQMELLRKEPDYYA
ncbi:STM4014 family protein [Paenibacillus sp. DCT19]|uniref:STM4014 family protein n=1 Tax=Paenibacillus sp. DCT19 TaxID=2211212 RepID=UPI0020C55BD5|nr:STM4014 family protein [Paenibacillus sp. DCT19]